MIVHPPSTCTPTLAAARGRAVFDAAGDGRPHLATSVVRGPAVVLGARQRREHVTSFAPCVRRGSTGTEVFVGETALWWSLGLPTIGALWSDTTASTLINRNVRGFLRPLGTPEGPAVYLGREVVSVRGKPVAVIGYDLAEDGRLLFEVILGWSDPVSLPERHRASRRAATPRDAAVAYSELVPSRSIEATIQRVVDAVTSRAPGPQALGGLLVTEPEGAPAPPLDAVGSARVPIGWVDAGFAAGAPWLGGDLLASTVSLDRAARALAQGHALPTELVMHGARPEDLARAWDAIQPLNTEAR